jgi:nitrogen fixation NifU-like protein
MADLDDLYQEVILDHNRSPRNFRAMADASHQAEGYNPLCGDQVTVYLRLRDGLIEDISFQGSGCAISKASASMMTAELKGKPQSKAAEMFATVHRMLTGNGEADSTNLGKLKVLSGVCKFPARVKCATLAWHTMHTALKGDGSVASTE